MDVEKKTFVEFYVKRGEGSPSRLEDIRERKNIKEVNHRNIQEVSLPENIDGFRFFDQIEAQWEDSEGNSHLLLGDIKNTTSWYFPKGEILFGLDDLEDSDQDAFYTTAGIEDNHRVPTIITKMFFFSKEDRYGDGLVRGRSGDFYMYHEDSMEIV